MNVLRTVLSLRRWRSRVRRADQSVALVPTMGALHDGHLSLIHLARQRADRTVVSIYVNPAQFGPSEDLSRYPRPLERDLAACRKAGASAVFVPETLYTPGHSTWVEETEVTQGGEGAQRPHHFRGVATVVLKLFNLVQPEVAVFGQKDAQQLQLIQRLVRDLDLPVEIFVGAIIRDHDGLALSSRNVYLSSDERTSAALFPSLLQQAAHQSNPIEWFQHQMALQSTLVLDYVEIRDHRLCAAIRVGRTRLLDNVSLPRSEVSP